jgi:hypothetical protein
MVEIGEKKLFLFYTMIMSPMKSQIYSRRGRFFMNSKENIVKEENTYMSNQEYREELRKIFDGINENYKLRWFYSFVREKLRSSN